MKLLTSSQIRHHATTPCKALNISIKHWQQLVEMPAKELRKSDKTELLGQRVCGLCCYYTDCLSCVLKNIGKECLNSNSPYHLALGALELWRDGETTIDCFRKEAKKMVKILESLKGKAEGI